MRSRGQVQHMHRVRWGAGATQFVISGLNTYQGSNRFMAVNSSDGSWTIDSFDVEFEDGSGELWTVTLEDSQWSDD